jgi:TRAP-type C4-dicarboxylate transport system substrate-binding protein
MRVSHIALAALSALALSAAAASAQTTTLVFNSFVQPKHPLNVLVLLPWAADVEKATQGRVKITIPPTTAAPPPQVMDATQKGIVDGGYVFNAFVANQIKLAQIGHLPWGNGTTEAMSVALWRTHQKFFAKANEYKNVELVGLFLLPPGEIYSMKGPINSVKDLAGVKVWALPGTAARAMEALKAGVVATPAVRSHETISAGTVDAFVGTSVSDNRAFNTLQYAKSITDVPGKLNSPSFSMFFNRTKWAALKPEDRDAITKLTGESFARRFAAIDKAETAAWEEAVGKMKIQHVKASAEFVADLRKATRFLEDEWIAEAKKLGVDGDAALKFYRDTVAAGGK